MDINGNEVGNVGGMDKKMTISEPTLLETGSPLDIVSHLSTLGKKYHPLLIGHETEVDLDVLNGKVVMICFFSLPFEPSFPDMDVAQAVSLVSSEMHVFGAFELVLVVNIDRSVYPDHKMAVAALTEFMSGFPSFCLAVPCPVSNEVFWSLNFPFAHSSDPVGLLVNRSHTVDWHKPLNFFLEYGVDAFPFTCERLAEITQFEENDRELKGWQPFHSFLCYSPLPSPNILRKNPGGGSGKVRIHSLDCKCVGLYVCQTGNLIPTLDKIQKSCCALGLEFEIVLVYVPWGNPEAFQDRINSALAEQNISWWVLPFVYWVSRRIWRLCHKDAEDRLIIIDPKLKIVEFHGEAIIRHFGIDAYPFSRECLINKELERLSEVTLESLLVYGSRDYCLWMGSDFSYQVPMAALRGKNVLLYLHYSCDHCDNFFDQLISYCQSKAHDPDFEAVFVGFDTSSFPYFGNSHAMPRLVFPLDHEHLELVSEKVFRDGGKCSTVLAFEKDGCICSLRAQQLVCSSCPESPFNINNLLDDIISELFGDHQIPECCL